MFRVETARAKNRVAFCAEGPYFKRRVPRRKTGGGMPRS